MLDRWWRTLVSVVWIGLVAVACGSPAPPPAGEPSLTRLTDLYQAEHLQDAVVPQPVPRSEWVLADLEEGWGWRAPVGVAEAGIDDAGRLTGRVLTERPVVELTAPDTLGAGDRLYAIELTLRVSEGDTLSLAVLDDEGPPTEAFAGEAPESPPLGLSTPLTPGDDVKTYRFDMGRSIALGPFSRREPNRVVFRPSEVPGAEFAVESVRLIFRQEHYASVESGLGWHGLGEVWREALASRPGERLVLPVAIPTGRPVLDLAVGTPVDHPITFAVEVSGADGSVVRLAQRTVTQSDRWEEERIDLAPYQGQEIELTLRAVSEDTSSVALWGAPILGSRGAGAAAPDAVAPQGVVLVIADTLRRDHLDAWGYDRPTAPRLSRMAAEGVRFEDAIAQAVWTKVSVPSILSGLYPATHGIVEIPDRLPASATTLAEAYRAAGYATMATSSWSFTGQLTNLHQGVDVLWEGGSVDLPDGSDTKTARFFMDQALEFVERHRELPFLVVLHVGDPHSPYRPLGRYADLWTEPGDNERHAELAEKLIPEIESDFYRRMELPQQSDLERAGEDLEWWRNHEINWYDASLRALDAEVGRLVDRIDHLGLTDRVVVGFIADHGEEFFEHGHNWHGANLYGYQTDIPLVLWGPGFLPAGVEVASTIQSIDLYPTLLELSGIDLPEITQGRSLLPLVTATANSEDPSSRGYRVNPAFVQRAMEDDAPGVPDEMTGESWAIVEGDWRLIHNSVRGDAIPEFELYDRRVDPLSTTDVADQHPEVVERLASQLCEWREWVAEHQLEADSTAELSAEELERLRSLGYI